MESPTEASVLEHLPTVRYIARRIHSGLPPQVELDDLVQAGILGLLDAFAKFEPAKQVQFKSYAQFRIRGAILDSLRAMDDGPRALRRKARDLQTVLRVLRQRLRREPEPQEAAGELGVSLSEYQVLLGDIDGMATGSLDAELSEDDSDTLLAKLADTRAESALAKCLRDERWAKAAACMESLPVMEQLVLELTYEEEWTMAEIAELVGVVESRVSQLRALALDRLRRLIAGRDPIDDMLDQFARYAEEVAK